MSGIAGPEIKDIGSKDILNKKNIEILLIIFFYQI